jgi:hypothetical protein
MCLPRKGKLQEEVQVTICHPKIIETGLDLLSHPSLIFYETGYSLHTLRQASRRSWRIGQWQPVRVYYLHYKETVQTSCLRLMGKKLLVSLALEGKFSDEGLQALGEEDDILTAMARELVNDHRIGEPADVVWRQIRAEHSRTFPAATAEPGPEEPHSEPPQDWVPVPQLAPALPASMLTFGSPPPESTPRRRTKRSTVVSEHQLALF